MSAIKRNFVYNLVLTLSNVIFPIVTFPYAARILGPEGIGKVQFATNLVQYFVFIAALGIPIYGIREVAKVKNDPEGLKRFFTTLLLLNIGTSLILFLIYFLTIYVTPSLYNDRHFYFIASLMLILSFCNIDWFFSGLEKFRFIAIRSVIVKTVFLVILFLLVKKKSDEVYYLWVTVGAAIMNNVYNILSAREYFEFKLFNIKDLKPHLKPLFYIFSTVVAASIYSSLDTIVLGFLKGFKDVGYYAAASRINKMTIPFLTSLSMVIMPQMAHAFKEQDQARIETLINSSFDFIIVLGVPMTLGLIALAPELIILFSGHQFLPAIFAMQLMAPVVLIIGLSTVWAVQVLAPAGKDKQSSISVFAGLVVSVILNFLLIPSFSFIGATIANVLAELAVMCGFAYFASKIVRQNYNIANIIRTLAVSLLFLPVIFFLRNLFPGREIVVCALGLVSCSLLYFGFQIFVFKNGLLIDQMVNLKKRFKV